MLTLYTAVGSLKLSKNSNGNSVPTILNGGKEYGLTNQELVLWSCLAFQILQIHELESAHSVRMKDMDCTDLSFSHYLNRLLLRGLVVKGEGITGVDALYRLLGELHILPIRNSFTIRFFTCLQLYMDGKVKLTDFSKYFKKEKWTPVEQTVLKLAEAIPLTTAELVTCVEQDRFVNSHTEMMETLYHDPTVSFHTLAEDVQLHHVQYPVLQAIGNLYLNKQIVFHKC